MDSVRLYDLFSGKIEAERSREGCPLTFRPSKVGTFGDRAQKTMNRPEIAELPGMIGHWFQWIQSGYMTYFRGKLKPSEAGKVAN